MRVSFWRVNIGQVLIVLTILYAALIFTLTMQLDRLSRKDEEHDIRINKLTEQTDTLWWYKEQGVDFKRARELGIKPPEDQIKK